MQTEPLLEKKNPFEEFGLRPEILRAVAEKNYTVPTPIQEKAIPIVLEGKDLIGCAQTGTGKTAAFALPILHRLQGTPWRGTGRRPIRVLVLTPTRELASQIAESFGAYGRHTALKHAIVFGGVNQGPQSQALRRGIDILVATPGRLLDLMNQGFADLAARRNVRPRRGRPHVRHGLLPRPVTAHRQAAHEAANLDVLGHYAAGPIEQLAVAILHDPVHVRVAAVQATTVSLIDQSVCFVAKLDKPKLLVKQTLQEPAVQQAIVFTRTKHGAHRVTPHLEPHRQHSCRGDSWQ